MLTPRALRRTALPAAAVAALAAANAGAADIEAGKKKVQEVCAACHGIDGGQPTTPEYPKLSGQNAAYIVAALKEYKNGNRAHPSMKAIAASLSDADMADLAAYYSQTPLTTASK